MQESIQNPYPMLQLTKVIPRNQFVLGESYAMLDLVFRNLRKVVYQGYSSVFNDNDDCSDYNREIEYHFFDPSNNTMVMVSNDDLDSEVFIHDYVEDYCVCK